MRYFKVFYQEDRGSLDEPLTYVYSDTKRDAWCLAQSIYVEQIFVVRITAARYYEEQKGGTVPWRRRRLYYQEFTPPEKALNLAL